MILFDRRHTNSPYKFRRFTRIPLHFTYILEPLRIDTGWERDIVIRHTINSQELFHWFYVRGVTTIVPAIIKRNLFF